MNRKVLVITLIAAVISAAAGWIAGARVKSPAEAAAATAPPEPSPIVVPAELRTLSTDVITRGTGRYASGQKLRLAPSTLKSGRGVVTSVAAGGARLRGGSVAMTISGRPVFLLRGRIPVYRDLGPGMSGADVRQLEHALARLRLSPGSVDGTFDGATESAVARLYARAGHSTFRASESDLARTRPRQASFVDGARARAGIQVPADEIIFVPNVPVRVSEVLIPRGATVDGPIMTVTSSTIVIDSSVPVEEARLIAPGRRVLIDEPDLSIKGTGTIAQVADGPGTNGLDGYHVYFQVRVQQAPTRVVNASVRLLVPIESTEKKVLAVPVVAVTLATDGTSRVEKQTASGFETVTVVPGLSADGFVEVKVVDGALEPGDLVLVGFENAPAAQSGAGQTGVTPTSSASPDAS